jgi:hypothetical protein
MLGSPSFIRGVDGAHERLICAAPPAGHLRTRCGLPGAGAGLAEPPRASASLMRSIFRSWGSPGTGWTARHPADRAERGPGEQGKASGMWSLRPSAVPGRTCVVASGSAPGPSGTATSGPTPRPRLRRRPRTGSGNRAAVQPPGIPHAPLRLREHPPVNGASGCPVQSGTPLGRSPSCSGLPC